ncbi:hypothetical protein Q3G72_006343 [Acer saccharum]|nr:hypothetical protein Q3G72_006343 [Acer saccharum]
MLRSMEKRRNLHMVHGSLCRMAKRGIETILGDQEIMGLEMAELPLRLALRETRLLLGGMRGSRFDVLNVEMDNPRVEEPSAGAISTDGNRMKGKTVLSEVTNTNGTQIGKFGKGIKKSNKKNTAGVKAVGRDFGYQESAGRPSGSNNRGPIQIHKAQVHDSDMEGIDSASILHHLHTEITAVENNTNGLAATNPVQDNLTDTPSSNFDAVASSMAAAMAIVLE